MINFYQNRAGKNLSSERHEALQMAKEELRSLFKVSSVEEWLKKEAPAKSKAQARFMAHWEKEHGHPEKAKEWFEGTSKKPEHVKKKKATLELTTISSFMKSAVATNSETLESTADLPFKATGGSFGNKEFDRFKKEDEKLPNRIAHRVKSKVLGPLKSLNDSVKKKVKGMVHGEEPEDSEKSASEEKEVPSERLEYETIVKMIAESHCIDLTTPEGIELLPIIMRETDHVLQQHKKLEAAENEIKERGVY